MTDQGSVYFAFTQSSLKDERDRRTNQETKASGIITTSAAVVALVFALVPALLGKDHKFTAGGAWLAIVALGLFTVAALCALMASLLYKYKVPDRADLEKCLGEHWTHTETTARLTCAWMTLETLTTLREGNNRRSWWLDAALRIQLMAVLVFAVAVAFELQART